MAAFLYALPAVPLFAAAVQDWRTRKVRDLWWVLITLISILIAWLEKAWLHHLLGFLLLGIPILIFSVITDGAGGGDVKLCMALGALVGVWQGYLILALALVILIVCLKLRKRSRGAFAPPLFAAYAAFLCMAIFIA